MLPDAHAQVGNVTSVTIGDPFTIGEGGDMLDVALFVNESVLSSSLILPSQSIVVLNNSVDTVSQILVIESQQSRNVRSIIIDLDTTLGELQQTIDSTKRNTFQYNVTSLTDSVGITSIYLVIAEDFQPSTDDMVITDDGASGIALTVPLVDNVDPQGISNPLVDSLLYNTTYANNNIGLAIDFNTNVRVDGTHPIIADFLSFESDGTPVNDITRTFHEFELPPGPEPSGLTQERLAALIEVRNLALDQQNLQIDYWSDPTNPFADNRVMAQDRLNNANYHISITTIQRDSYQAELDRLTG